MQEFSHKKKLAKSDSKISDELRLVSWIVYVRINIENIGNVSFKPKSPL